MSGEQQALEVNEQKITRGTSFFDRQTREVLWYTGIQDGDVQLAKVDGGVEMSKDAFKAHILADEFQIESRPPSHSE